MIITPPTNQPPIANPGGPYSGLVGAPVYFDGGGSSDSDGTLASYAWSFGDGITATGVAVSHTYSFTGFYEAKLTVTDNKGATATEGVSISVIPAQANMPPIARPGGPYSAAPGASIAFDGSTSNDPDGTVSDWSWDFGDGTTASGINVSHAYATPGTFTVRLTVSDNTGETGSATTTASIVGVNQAPIARTGGPFSGKTGVPVAFDGSLSTDADGTIASYAWSFGNGTTASGAKPTCTYTAAGSYAVTLTVTDDKGATNSTSTTALITDIPPVIVATDNFDDNMRNPQKWRLGATAATTTNSGLDRAILVAERNRRTEIVPRVAKPGERFFGITGTAIDFTGCSAQIMVPAVPAGNAEAVFSLYKDRQNFLQIRYKAGVLTFIQNAVGLREQATVAYSPTQHRYWRFRHDKAGDSLRFETSPDALVWTSERTTGRKIPVTLLYPELAAGTNVAVPIPGIAAFDSFVVEK